MTRAQVGKSEGMNEVQRLAVRISEMVGSPRAQENRCVTIHRLERESDRAWEVVLEQIVESGEVEVTFNDDASVTLSWEPADIEETAGPAEAESCTADETQIPF